MRPLIFILAISLNTVSSSPGSWVGGPANAGGGGSFNMSGGNTTSCSLDGGNPGQCDAAVTAGARCWIQVEGNTSADALAGTATTYPTSTTVRVTSSNGHTEVVDIFCNK
jgi:hypothetical protein